MKKTYLAFLFLFFLTISNARAIEEISIENSEEVKSILSDLKNYRFGNITLYQIKNTKEIEPLFKKVDSTEAAGIMNPKCPDLIKQIESTLSPADWDNIKSEVAKISKKAAVDPNEINNLNQYIVNTLSLSAFSAETVTCMIGTYGREDKTNLTKFLGYLVTERINKQGKVDNIIGFLGVTIPKSSEAIPSQVLSGLTPSNIYTQRDLLKMDLAANPNFNTKNMYNVLKNYIAQKNVEDITRFALGADNSIRLSPIEKGVTTTLLADKFEVTDKDVQLYKRISNGEPKGYKEKTSEITIGSDIIRYVQYKTPVQKPFELNQDQFKIPLDALLKLVEESNGVYDSVMIENVADSKYLKKIQDKNKDKGRIGFALIQDFKDFVENTTTNYKIYKNSLYSSNDFLPDYGVELLYGQNDFILPNFASNRLTLNVILGELKLGLILPADILGMNYKSLGFTKDLFSSNLRFANPGVGINGKVDINIPLIPKTEVFELSGGVQLANPTAVNYNDLNLNDAQIFVASENNAEYNIRGNLQLHYTFGFSIDNNYLFRFGIGGAYYDLDKWNFKVVRDTIDGTEESKVDYYFDKSYSFGGVSAKIDFMSKAGKTPYGFNLQYLGGLILPKIWLQANISDDVNVKFETQGLLSPFKSSSDSEKWIPSNLFSGSIRFTYIF